MNKTAVSLLAAAALGGAGVAVALVISGNAAAVDDQTIFCTEYVPNAQAESNYNKWTNQNPGDRDRWTGFRDDICAGDSPTPPTMVSSKGKGLVAAGKMALPEEPPPTTTSDTTTTTTTTPPPPPPPPPPPGAQVSVAPTGNDSTCARGDLTKPCATFNKAYHDVAQCGDLVSVVGGTYGEQTLRERGSCAGNPITIKGPLSAFTPRLRFGSVVGGISSDSPDDIVIDGLHVAGYILQGDATNITIKNTDGGAFFLQGAQNIQVLNSDWGRCSSPATPNHPFDDCLGSYSWQQSRIVDNGTGAGETKNILIQGSVFHDHVATDPDHWEALWTNGGTDVTWRGNRIYNNSNTAAIWFDTPANVRGTWIFENNWFGKENNGSAIGIARLPFTGTVIVRFNSFAAGEGVMNQGGGTNNASGRLQVVGNIIGQHSCIAGANYSYNVTLGSQTCAGTGNVNVSSLPYVDGSNGASGNYHLSATTVADNHVPVGTANADTTTDYDGQARPIGAAKDAGADER